MDVLRITPRGYCHGVVDAFRIAKRVRESTEGPVHMLEQGVALVDPPNRLAGLEMITEGTVIFTAHGVSPQVKARAAEKGLNAVDATCSDVVRTHDLVCELAARGCDVVYVGKRGHPEPEGVEGEAPGRVHLVQDLEDVARLDIRNPQVAITCQTTLSLWDTEALIEAVRERFPHVEVYNEICRATQERQEAAVAAAKEVDLVVVVGSPRSSNSNRLVEVVRQLGGKPAYMVGSVEEVDLRWFDGVERVGVTSGASTPTKVTRSVMEYLESLEGQPDGRYEPPAAAFGAGP
jgi:4-hydroxy-3-methylbut-2-enyl diphosphate reductase